jgi:hypothetical protein
MQMMLSEASPIVQSAKPALELISLASLPPRQASQILRASLLANPNYFGRLTSNSFKAVLNIHKDTTFENIGGIVYNPRFEQLQATVTINQSHGYSGASCKYGSEEYVRLYLSYDWGATWQDQGVRSVNVLDTSHRKPLEYIVSVSISPAQTFCFMQNLPLARAILSWNTLPPTDSPDWTPVWGNVVDEQVRFAENRVNHRGRIMSETSPELPEEMAALRNLEQVIDTLLQNAPRTTDMYKPDSFTPDSSQSLVGFSITSPTASPQLAVGTMALSEQMRLLRPTWPMPQIVCPPATHSCRRWKRASHRRRRLHVSR